MDSLMIYEPTYDLARSRAVEELSGRIGGDGLLTVRAPFVRCGDVGIATAVCAPWQAADAFVRRSYVGRWRIVRRSWQDRLRARSPFVPHLHVYERIDGPSEA